MKVQLVRHATLVVEMKGIRLLVDPMLSLAGTMDPAANSANTLRNPLVDLPDGIMLETLQKVDAVVITHTHRDHFDDVAVRLVPTDVSFFCQPEDSDKIMETGFTNVTAIHDTVTWNGIRMTRTRGRHGTGEMGAKMGPVSGFVFEAASEPSLYVTGDTVWCPEVEQVCRQNPDVIVAFAGGAEFLTGGPITMTAEDVYQVTTTAVDSHIIPVHMEAWNHCLLKRADLESYLQSRGADARVVIPRDGDTLEFH